MAPPAGVTRAGALPPAFAGWRHRGARGGFEVVFVGDRDDGLLCEGHTAAIEEGRPLSVGYAIALDARWRTRWARVRGRSSRGERTVTIDADGEGRWRLDGAPAPHLDGCLDLDLESSSLTNAFPVHRPALPHGARAEAPAAYVRALGLDVERLEQTYSRIDDAARSALRLPRAAVRLPVHRFL